MESGESLGPPVSARGLRMAQHAEAKGDAAATVALLGAPRAGNGRAALPVASPRPPGRGRGDVRFADERGRPRRTRRDGERGAFRGRRA